MSDCDKTASQFPRPNGNPSWRKEWDEFRSKPVYRGVLVDNGKITWRCPDTALRVRSALQDARDGGCWRSYDGQGNGWTPDMAWMPEAMVRARKEAFFKRMGEGMDIVLARREADPSARGEPVLSLSTNDSECPF